MMMMMMMMMMMEMQGASLREYLMGCPSKIKKYPKYLFGWTSSSLQSARKGKLGRNQEPKLQKIFLRKSFRGEKTSSA